MQSVPQSDFNSVFLCAAANNWRILSEFTQIRDKSICLREIMRKIGTMEDIDKLYEFYPNEMIAEYAVIQKNCMRVGCASESSLMIAE